MSFGITNAGGGGGGSVSYIISVTVSMDDAVTGDLEGFTVKASYSGGSELSATTGSDGTCTFEGELGKTYTITATKVGFKTATGSILIENLLNKVTLTTSYDTYTYTPSITNGTASSSATPTYKTDFTVTIVSSTGYDVPAKNDITVTVGGSAVDFTYSEGTITIAGTNITGDIAITATCPAKTFDYTASLENGSVSSASGTATYGQDLTLTFGADDYYNLPSDLTVKIGNAVATKGTDYSLTAGSLVVFGAKILGEITITGECIAQTFSVSGNITNGSITSGTASYNSDYTATIVRTNEYYNFPSEVTVTIGGAESTAFTYTSSTGEVVITGSAIKGAVVITGICSPKSFTFSTSVTNGTASPSSGTCTYGTDFNVTITAGSGFVLPTSVSATAGGTAITPAYDSSTGVVTIPGSSITGTIVISATCPVDQWVYGLTINETNSSTSGMISLTDDCKNFGKCAGSSSGTFTITDSWASANIIKDIAPYNFDETTWTALNKTNEASWPTTGDCFTEIPAFHYGISKSGNTITVKMSNKSFDGSTQGAFLASDGVTVRNETHIGCFYASGDASGVYSKPGSTPKVNMALNQYWVGASKRKGEYDCFPFQQLVVLQIIYLLMFQDTNCQTAFARGYVDNSFYNPSGGSALTGVQPNTLWTYDNNFGMAGVASGSALTQDKGMSFFWVHDLWGNMYQFIASIFTRAGSSLEMYQVLGRMADSNKWDNGSWNSTSNYAQQTSVGTTTGSTGKNLGNYYTKACGTNGAGFIISSDVVLAAMRLPLST